MQFIFQPLVDKKSYGNFENKLVYSGIFSIPSIPRTAKEKLLSSTAHNGEKGLN